VGREAFSRKDADLLKRLAPHLGIAARNFFSAQSLRLLDTLRREALDAVSVALMAIDSSGRLLYANRMGEGLLGAGTLLRIVGGLLSAGTAVVEETPLTNALAQLRQGYGATLLLTDRHTNIQMMLNTAPVSQSEPIGRSAGLIWVNPMAADASSVHRIARLFGLTAAEYRLLLQLAAGEDLRSAAEALQISVHTARCQLKSIFFKTGRHTQAHLMQLVGKMAAICSQPPHDARPAARRRRSRST
jgi:DNA-binding CsgD family transcriptional regulator